ncbi:MAG: alpha/beta hydrolase [Alphaproteobacteria bacterium]|nr:alpha/beta hydrolase [Alphaproteobacteria bacterium]
MLAGDQISSNWSAILDRIPDRMCKTPSGSLAFRCSGRGPDIVLLHGIGSGSASWVYLLDSLSGSFSVTAWDAPGYGASSPISADWPTVEDYARSLADLVECRAIENCILIGHSLGALVATRFAAKWPALVRALILADPASGHGRLPAAESAKRLKDRIDRFEHLGNEAYAIDRTPALLSANPCAAHSALVRFNLSRLDSGGYLKAARMLSQADIYDDLPHLKSRCLVVCGESDRITPPADCRRIADAIGDKCGLVEIEGAGHASYIEAPERFDRIVREFSGVVR